MSQLLQFFVILICIAIFAFSSFAQSRWSIVGMTPDSAVWLVDKATKKKASGVIQAWEKVVYQDSSYSIALNEWKCSEKMKRLLQVNHYDPRGDYLSRSLTPLPWRYIVPDSIEEKTYKIVCNGSDKQESETGNNKKEVSKSSFAQIIVRKAKLMSEARSDSKIIRNLSVGEKLALLDEKSGAFYEVLDPKSGSQGWVNGNYFKIIKANNSPRKNKVRKTK